MICWVRFSVGFVLVSKEDKSSAGEKAYVLTATTQDLIDKAQDLQYAIVMIEQLQGGFAYRASIKQVAEIIDALLRGIPHMNYPVSEGFRAYKGRIEPEDLLIHKNDFSY